MSNRKESVYMLITGALIALALIITPLAFWCGFRTHDADMKRAGPFSIQTESILLHASTEGCTYGALMAEHHKKTGIVDRAYKVDEDMKKIDFSQWNVEEKSMAAFKERFKRSFIACYRQNV